MAVSYRFSHRLRVRYSEIDGQKIVFNSHYLTYIDIAVIEYFREVLGENWLQLSEINNFDIALVHISIDFHQPAVLDDWLTIHCKVSKLGRSSMNTSFLITRNLGESVLSAEAVYVNYNSKEKRSQPIPACIREKIEQYESEE